MKFALVYLLAVSSVSTFATETEAQTKCAKVFRSVLSKNAAAQLELMEKMKDQGRISDDNLDEFDRVIGPSRKVVTKIYEACKDEAIDMEQVELLKKTLL